MDYNVFLAVKPGDKFIVGSMEKVVVARVPFECMLFTDGSTMPFQEVGDRVGTGDVVEITHSVYEYLANKLEFPVAPGLHDFVVGDYVLLVCDDRTARVLVVATVAENTVYSQDGEMIPLDDPTVIRSGFWSESNEGCLV